MSNPLPDVSQKDAEEGKYETVQDHPIYREGDEGILAVKIPFLFPMEEEGRMRAYLCIRKPDDSLLRPIELRVQELSVNAEGDKRKICFVHTLNAIAGHAPRPEWWKIYLIVRAGVMALLTFPEEWDRMSLKYLRYQVGVFCRGVYRGGARTSEKTSAIISHIRQWADAVQGVLMKVIGMLRPRKNELDYLNLFRHFSYEDVGEGRPSEAALFDFVESSLPSTDE